MTFLEWQQEVFQSQAVAAQLRVQIHAWTMQAFSMVGAAAKMPAPSDANAAEHGVEVTWSNGHDWLRLLIASEDLVVATGAEPSRRAVASGKVRIGTELPADVIALLKHFEVSDGDS